MVSVHSHLGLLGRVSPAASGLVCLALPGCAANRLARLHFWLHELGLPVMMASLAAVHLGGPGGSRPRAAFHDASHAASHGAPVALL